MKTITLALTVLVSLFFANSQNTNAQNYKINTEESKINWVGYKLGGQHAGDLMLSSGTLKSNDKGISGKFIIDMTTINCTDLEGEKKGNLEDHLAADDFFDVENHSKAKFKLNKVSIVRPVEGSDVTHKVSGELSIKDITHTVHFPATIVINGDDMTAKANLTIDRTLWGIEYNSAGNVLSSLADKVIYDDIELELDLVAKLDNTFMEDVKEVAEKVGEGTKKTAIKVGEETKEAAEKVGEETKEVVEKVGEGTKKVIKKVGDTFKKDKDKKDNE